MHTIAFNVILGSGALSWTWWLLRFLVMVVGCGFGVAGPVIYLPYRDLPAGLEKVPFAVQDGKVVGWAWRTLEGSVAVKTKVEAPAESRKNFEERLPPGEKVGLPGYERCHTHGRIWGVESPYSIFHAEKEINRQFQAWGIEEFVRKLNQHRRPGVEIWVTSESKACGGSTILESTTYRVEATAGVSEKPTVLFETGFRMEKVRSEGDGSKSRSNQEVGEALGRRKVLLETPVILNAWEHFLKVDRAAMERNLQRLKGEAGMPGSEARPSSTEASREKAFSEKKTPRMKAGESRAAHPERMRRPSVGH